MAKKLSGNLFKPQPIPHSNRLGGVGYDNGRENIDPHIKTKAVSTKEVATKNIKFPLGSEIIEQPSGHLQFNASTGIMEMFEPNVDNAFRIFGSLAGTFRFTQFKQYKTADEIIIGSITPFTTPKVIFRQDVLFGANQSVNMEAKVNITSTKNLNSAASMGDLSVEKKITSATLNVTGLTLGSVLFAGASGLVSQDSFNLFWDAAINQLEPNLLKITSDGTQAAPALKFNDTNTGFFKSGDSIRTSINNSTKMTIDATGVGIGTATPDTKLQVVGDTKLGDDNTNYVEVGTTGNVVFVGSAGLAFAEIYAQDNTTPTTITTAGKANKVQITIFDSNGLSNNCTPDHNNDHITITKAGIYKVNVDITSSGAGGDTDTLGFSLYKNNVINS